jgi:hypothetical protein
MTKNQLVTIMHRKVGYEGILSSTAGAKKTVVKKIKDLDVDFITIVFGKLSSENECFVNEKLNRFFTNFEEQSLEHVRLGDLIVTNKMFRQFKVGCPMDVSMLLALMALFARRDEKIFAAHSEVNSRNANYIPFVKSIFLGPQILYDLINFPDSDSEYFAENIIDLNRIYIVYNERNNENNLIDGWTLVTVNLKEKSMWYFDPKLDNSLDNLGNRAFPIDEATNGKIICIKNCINMFLRKKILDLK